MPGGRGAELSALGGRPFRALVLPFKHQIKKKKKDSFYDRRWFMNNVRVAFRPAPSLSSVPAGAGAAGAHYPVVRASGTFFTQFPFPSSISHFRFPTRFLIGYIFSERRYRGAHLQWRKPGPREIEELDSGRRAGYKGGVEFKRTQRGFRPTAPASQHPVFNSGALF